MKKIYAAFALFLFSAPSFAQNVILFENFEDTTTYQNIIISLANGNDTTWIDADYDGLPDASGGTTERPGEWFLSFGFADVDTNNTVMASNSWTDDASTPIANYLILPPIWLATPDAMLSWKYAPRQTPRFLDGLQVLVSKTGNFPEDFEDTLMVYAEYISGDALPGDTTFANFEFTDGYVLGAQPEDYNYLQYDNDSLRFIGILRPDSASLAGFAGHTVYIAFCHGTTDDNLVAIDDIKVTGTGAVSVNTVESAPLALTAYPNPAGDQFRIAYDMPGMSRVQLNLFDATGKMVKQISNGTQIKGHYYFDVDTRDLSSGMYKAVLKTNASTSSVKVEVIR